MERCRTRQEAIIDQRQKLKTKEQVAIDNFVHTPAETASNYVKYAQDITKYHGITWGCQLDNHIIPLRPGRKLGLLARPGHGKSMGINEKVLTPYGWQKIGALCVDDEVMSPSGGTAIITGVYPQGIQEIYELTLSDGTKARSSADHLWKVQHTRDRRTGKKDKWRVLPLKEIMNSLRDVDRTKWYLPLVESVLFDSRNLPMEPYLLGALVGDGCIIQSCRFTAADPEMIELISRSLPSGMQVRHIDRYDYILTGGRTMRDASGHHFNPLVSALRELGLLGCRSYDKFIPPQYLMSSVSQRIALLQGLLDTDGQNNGSSNTEYQTCSPQLARDVVALVQSLGGTAKIGTRESWYTYKGERKPGKLSHRVGISLPRDITPFRVTRKAVKYNPGNKYPPHRSIISVDLVGTEEAVCIKLDSEDGLFITNDYIVTHNTTLGGFMVKREAQRIVRDGEQGKRYAAHISWEQSVEELEAMYQDSTGYGVTDVAWGKVPINTVVRDSLKRPSLPVWIFGDSLYKSTLDTPPMTVEAVYDSIQGIWKTWGMLPSVLFFDYIQDIPVPLERDRYMQVSSAMRLVSRLAIQVQCPVIIGIQANQRTDDKKTPVPEMRDAEWSAVIGQKLDVLLSLWRPIRTHLPHDEPTIEVGGETYKNTEQLLVMKLLKQRFEKGYGIFAEHFDPNKLTLNDYKLTPIDPWIQNRNKE